MYSTLPSGSKSRLPAIFPNRKPKQILDDTAEWFNCLCGFSERPKNCCLHLHSARAWRGPRISTSCVCVQSFDVIYNIIFPVCFLLLVWNADGGCLMGLHSIPHAHSLFPPPHPIGPFSDKKKALCTVSKASITQVDPCDATLGEKTHCFSLFNAVLVPLTFTINPCWTIRTKHAAS